MMAGKASPPITIIRIVGKGAKKTSKIRLNNKVQVKLIKTKKGTFEQKKVKTKKKVRTGS